MASDGAITVKAMCWRSLANPRYSTFSLQRKGLSCKFVRNAHVRASYLCQDEEANGPYDY